MFVWIIDEFEVFDLTIVCQFFKGGQLNCHILLLVNGSGD